MIGVAAPLTGSMAWGGERTRAGAYMALEDLNVRGGVLGEPLAVVLVDDFCDPDQAVAPAQKLVAEGVPFVVGHQCSGAAIPASAIYEDASIVLISPAATNPQLTDRGLRYTFRTCGRDDVQGTMVGDSSPRRGPARISRSSTTVRRTAKGRRGGQTAPRWLGIETAVFEQVQPGQTEFFDLVGAFEAHGIDVVFYGGYPAEAGLIVRQAPSHSLCGARRCGLLADRRRRRRGHPDDPYMDAWTAGSCRRGCRLKVDGTDPTGTELFAYAAVQAWAQAVEQAGTTDAARIAEVLRQERLDTVLGTIGFDAKGDVTGFDPFVWYVWTEGKYVPKDLTD